MHLGIWYSDPKLLLKSLKGFAPGSQFVIASGSTTTRGEIYEMGVDDDHPQQFWVSWSWYYERKMDFRDSRTCLVWAPPIGPMIVKEKIFHTYQKFYIQASKHGFPRRLKARFLLDNEEWDPDRIDIPYGLYRFFEPDDPTNLVPDELTGTIVTLSHFRKMGNERDKAYAPKTHA